MPKKPSNANTEKKDDGVKPPVKKEEAKSAAPVKKEENKQTPAAQKQEQVQNKNQPKKAAEPKKEDTKKVPEPKKEEPTKAPAAKKDEPKKVIEPKKDADSDSSSDSDDMPELIDAADAAGADDGTKNKHSRSERKAIKAMTKIGLKHIKEIVRVTIRRTKSLVFVISPAEVYKANNMDTYIIFGDAKMEDMSAQAQLAAAEKFKNLSKDKDAVSTQPTIKEESEEEDDENVDAGDLAENDISLVMTQANVSKAKAIKALKENNNDIVNAIMKLTV